MISPWSALLPLTLTLAPGAAQVSDDQRPPLIHWQRTLRDALHLAEKKKLPLLVVANQDGERACESLATDRYRSKAFANLANRYVAVIASLNRHNPRDYDEQGRRIPCPRFGCVTCGEHMAIEPKLFAKYFKGNATAPRHIGISPGGKEMFDRFLDGDLRMIDNALRNNAKRPAKISATDRVLAGLLASRAHTDRHEIEARFSKGDTSARVRILTAARRSGNDHADLIRLGIRTDDQPVRAAAVALLVATATPDDLNLMLQSLGTARSQDEYDRLVQALEKPAKSDKQCARALTIRRALAAKSKGLDPARWARHVAAANNSGLSDRVPDEELEELDARIDATSKKAKVADPGGRHWMAVAHATFRYALNRLQNRKDPTFLLLDTERAVKRAIESKFAPARAASLRARVHWLLNQPEAAGAQATLALAGDPSGLAGEAASPTAAAVLDIYARRQAGIVQANRDDGAPYPTTAVTAAHRAYQILANHPHATAAHADAYFRLLHYLGARYECGLMIRRAVRRFPAAQTIHELYWDQLKWEGGLTALENGYDHMVPKRGAALDYFAGYATLTAAEGHVRSGHPDRARHAYAKSTAALYASASADADYADWGRHFAALALGALARFAMADGDLGAAVDAVLKGAGGRPASFADKDGLGNTLARTTRRLRRRLKGDEHAPLLERLNRGLAELGIE